MATAAFDLPDKIAEQHRAFERGNTPPGTSDLRTRLTAVGNSAAEANTLYERAERILLDEARTASTPL